ncbi:MAG: NHL repeat-containing protein [Caldilineaceae bacterium]
MSHRPPSTTGTAAAPHYQRQDLDKNGIADHFSTFPMHPLTWLGAYSPGGLALPAAQPTASQLYAPRGVYLDDHVLIVADSGNHRVLIWHGVPTHDQQPADVVLGQPDFTSEGAQAGGRGPENGLYLPTAVTLIANQLYIADAWNHRILIWNKVPQHSFVPPDRMLGQADLTQVSENRGGEASGTTLYWPYSLAWIAGWFYIADTGNRRVLGWKGVPENDQSPDLLLGQDDLHYRFENRGGAVAANTFRWPHAIAGNEDVLYVADAGNHRLLGWSPRAEADRTADLVLGQPDFTQAQEWPYSKQSAQKLRFPYSASMDGGRLAVADTANNRVLFWHDPPQSGIYHAANAVLGQPDFESNGENRWKMVERDTLCWPYGIHLHGNRLAVADSGNNRVMIWGNET